MCRARWLMAQASDLGAAWRSSQEWPPGLPGVKRRDRYWPGPTGKVGRGGGSAGAPYQAIRWSNSNAGPGCASTFQSVSDARRSSQAGGPRAGAMRGGATGSPSGVRMRCTGAVAVTKPIRRRSVGTAAGRSRTHRAQDRPVVTGGARARSGPRGHDSGRWCVHGGRVAPVGGAQRSMRRQYRMVAMAAA
jgi:hypothetical protein